MQNTDEAAFGWIELVPAAVAVFDGVDLTRLVNNSLFAVIGEDCEDELKASLGAALKAETIINILTHGAEKPYVARAHARVIAGREAIIFVLLAVIESAPRHEKASGVIDFETARRLLDELLSQPETATTVCAVALDGAVDEDNSRRATTILKGCMRQSDILAKRGLDEFLMIFPRCRAKIVESILDNVRERFENVERAEGRGGRIKTHHAIVEAAFGKYGTGEQLLAAAIAEREAEKGLRF